ncbi:MAG: serine/threonine-protein kinase PknK, partial [Planctomycetes bacterium]|nr:serine/threonine-protein kinase PknK [Planctomycetota bacterium]
MIGTLLNQRYRILRALGEGGMSSVFLGEDTQQENRRVAVKVLLPEAARRETIRHFQHEFSLLTQLRHPHLAEVYDFGNDPATERFFFTCEYVEGGDLFEATRGLPLPEIAELFAQLCRALDYIHAKGLIHYDIKPSNILVHRPAPAAPPVAKLLDFGLAGEERGVGEFRVRGTVHYMAPEIVRAGRADRRADLYSLGVTLYQVITGELPFAGRSTQSVLRKHLLAPPPPPALRRPGLPAALEAVILRLLAKEPHERFGRAGEVIAALNGALGLALPAETRATRESYVLSGKLVGRDAEMAGLLHSLNDALTPGAGAAPACVAVSGEPGVGRSRILRELKVRVQISGATIHAVDAARHAGAPFGAFAELLRRMVGSLEPGAPRSEFLQAALRRRGAELVKLLPELGPRWKLAPSPALDSKEEALRLADALAGFLHEVSCRWPLVISLDDLESADQGTLDALAYLARNLALLRRAGAT